LEGTTAAFREAAIKKTEIRITEKITRKIGLVVYGLSPKIGGSSKSLVLGGTKPSPSAPERTNESTRTPIYSGYFWMAYNVATLFGKASTCEIQQ
jgi:hypothetical protein